MGRGPVRDAVVGATGDLVAEPLRSALRAVDAAERLSEAFVRCDSTGNLTEVARGFAWKVEHDDQVCV